MVVAEALADGPAVVVVLAEEGRVGAGKAEVIIYNSDEQWKKRYFQDGDLENIKNLVTEWEKKTKGNIVPMVVLRSGNVDFVQPMLFLILYALSTFWVRTSVLSYLEISFSQYLIFAAVISFFTSLALSRSTRIQRWISTKSFREDGVRNRAELEFYRNNFGQTRSHGAVLIFISLMEHRVEVLCDEYLKAKIPNEKLGLIADVVITEMKDDQLLSGLSKAIEMTGQMLADALPSKGKDLNEIADDLIIKK